MFPSFASGHFSVHTWNQMKEQNVSRITWWFYIPYWKLDITNIRFIMVMVQVIGKHQGKEFVDDDKSEKSEMLCK